MPQMTYSSNIEWQLRSRLKLNYSFTNKHLKPYVSVETYNPLENVNKNNWVTKVGYQAGIEWKIDAVNALEFYYMFEHEVTKKVGNHIIGIAYNLGL
jgi:hypothetical protein